MWRAPPRTAGYIYIYIYRHIYIYIYTKFHVVYCLDKFEQLQNICLKYVHIYRKSHRISDKHLKQQFIVQNTPTKPNYIYNSFSKQRFVEIRHSFESAFRAHFDAQAGNCFCYLLPLFLFLKMLSDINRSTIYSIVSNCDGCYQT